MKKLFATMLLLFSMNSYAEFNTIPDIRELNGNYEGEGTVLVLFCHKKDDAFTVKFSNIVYYMINVQIDEICVAGIDNDGGMRVVCDTKEDPYMCDIFEQREI